MSIKIFYDEIKFRLKGSVKIRKFLERVILAENRRPGDLSIIFTGDAQLLEINKKFLGHDYYTDVISFVTNEDGKTVSGEVYISVDTVRENSVIYRVPEDEEIIRVMIHGLLHICGYSDEADDDRKLMAARQEMWMEEFRRVVWIDLRRKV